jgi:glyoxylase-like metal-dependent hydrolase (beta-lactamase superfamily II)
VENNIEKPQLQIVNMELGPAATNTYIVGHPTEKQALIIDPAWDGDRIVKQAEERDWEITQIWLTHGHFDHFGGVAQIVEALSNSIEVALHPEDLPLWEAHGGAAIFGFPNFDPGPKPSLLLEDGMRLTFCDYEFEVRHTPGHSLGHVIFLLHEARLVFSGDLIFMQSVGRTDLPGGSWETLFNSIQANILNLPDDYQLLPGHGPMTTVGRERFSNPFLR